MKCRSGADNPLKIGGDNYSDTGGYCYAKWQDNEKELIHGMRSINRVPCALGAGVIGTAKVRCRTAAQRLGSSMRQGSNAS